VGSAGEETGHRGGAQTSRFVARAGWKGHGRHCRLEARARPSRAGRARAADWARRNRELEAALRDGPPRDCLRHPSVAFQMFVGEHHAVRELPYVTFVR